MKIKDCEARMGVEPKHDIGAIGVSKGEKLVIRKVEKDTNGGGGCEGYLYFDGKGHVGVSAEHFEPVNEFGIREKVIYKSFDSQTIKTREEAIIFGIAPEKDKLNREYAISYIHEGPYGEKKRVNKMVAEHKLLPLKKPDELEIGDKFKVKTAEGVSKRINEVLGVFEDKYYNQTKYVAKRMNGNYEGLVVIYNSEMIKEIIYD